MRKFWRAFIRSFRLFRKHDTLTLGAALAYYTGFSLIPIIIIVISIAGAVFGPQAVQGEITRQLKDFIGGYNAQQLQDIIKAVYRPGKNWLVTSVAAVLLVAGACSVFVQIRTSLNVIWGVKNKRRGPVIQFLIDRFFSFAMIICFTFLLLVALLLHGALAIFSGYMGRIIPRGYMIIVTATDVFLSMGITTLLIALVYKYMSDISMKWRSVWAGAFFTALLFVGGKYLMALYLSNYYHGDTYGSAGSLVLFLMWVFYSSQIVFFGAEFTQALADEEGIKLDTMVPHN